MFNEQRQSPRKVLRVKATLAMEGAAPVAGRTVDVGGSGICISTAVPLKAGQIGQVSFELYFDGKVTVVNARSQVAYCTFSNGEFKVGFQFLGIDLGAMTVLSKYLR